MYKQKLNEEDVFDYIKLGTDIGKIFIIILTYNEASKDDKDYCELVNSCNNRFKHLGINYKIKKSEFIYIAKDIGRGVISKAFPEPFSDEKYILFEIGYHLMYLSLVELTEEKKGKKTEALNNLYKKFKEYLINLKIPTYNLLELLFDNQIDMDHRMMEFTYELLKYFAPRQIDNDADNKVYKLEIKFPYELLKYFAPKQIDDEDNKLEIKFLSELCRYLDTEPIDNDEGNPDNVNKLAIEVTPRKKKRDVFISHANKDKEDFVEDLYLSLKKLGVDIFYDKESLGWGDNWKDKILYETNNSEFAIIVISENFFGREWTERELSEFLNQQNKNGQKLILPIIHNITIEQLKEKYPDVADIQVIDSKKYTCDEIALMFAGKLIQRRKNS